VNGIAKLIELKDKKEFVKLRNIKIKMDKK
jgi:hypothetical protein